MIPLSFGDIALLNHLLEEWGTRYQVRWKDSFTACLEPPGECCFTRSSSGKPWAGGEVLPGKGPSRGVLPGQTVFFDKGGWKAPVNQAAPQNRAAWFRIGRERAL